MNLQALGYVGIRTSKLEDWATYASRFLGMQLTDKTRSSLAFRMDDRKQRVVVERGRRRRSRLLRLGGRRRRRRSMISPPISNAPA